MAALNDFHSISKLSFISSCEKSQCHVKHLLPLDGKLGKKCYHILFIHNLLDYSLRYNDFFNALREKLKERVIISVVDLVGHGFSTGSRAYIDRFESFAEDNLKFMRASLDFYHEREIKTILVGTGLGATIHLQTLSHFQSQLPFPIDSLVAINPMVKLKFRLPELALSLSKGLRPYLGKMQIDNLYKGRSLSSADGKLLSYNNDPLVSKSITLSLLSELIEHSKQVIHDAYYLSYPVYFLLSGQDDITDAEATKSFMTAMPKHLPQVSFYNEAKHDLLNETCADKVFQEIIEYIEQNKWESQCKD